MSVPPTFGAADVPDVDAIERLVDGAVHRDAERLAAQGDAEIMTGGRPRDRGAQGEVVGIEDASAQGAPGLAGGTRDADVDHPRIVTRPDVRPVTRWSAAGARRGEDQYGPEQRRHSTAHHRSRLRIHG
jgi:hypothetical protein